MADHETTSGQETTRRRRRGPDPVAMVAGLLALAMAGSAFAGRLPVLPGFDARWLVAAGAAVLGILLLVGSLRRG